MMQYETKRYDKALLVKQRDNFWNTIVFITDSPSPEPGRTVGVSEENNA